MGIHTQRWGANRGADSLAYEQNRRMYGYGADPLPVQYGGMSQGTKDALTYVGTGVVGALIARNFARGAAAILLGGVGGVALAAWVILHPRSTTT